MTFPNKIVCKSFHSARTVRQTLRNSKSWKIIYVMVPFFLGVSATDADWKLPSSVQIQQAEQVLIEADPDVVARRSVPAALFGFNIPWMNFQSGYWRNNRVRPEVIQWLKPFTGAVYRYPGGEVSNWFEWNKSIGPEISRDKQKTYIGPNAKVEFGFDEFLDFVKVVNGVPSVTVNLKGTNGTVWDDGVASQSNAEWVRYALQREGGGETELTFCQVGKKCPVRWWELGNELDWGKDAWTAERYVSRVRTVGLAMKAVDPAVKLIAQTASSPWSKKRLFGPAAGEFNRAVGDGLADIVYGYAYHSYYDGISIPNANRYMESAVNALSVTTTGGLPNLFITEHARWPHKPMVGDWRDNWAQTGNLGGAISVADYQLSQMVIPNVRAMMWHALGARGPWQLFYINTKNDQPYPNVVYWGLRVLRQALLDDMIMVRVSSPNNSGYRGGYDVRAAFMRKEDGSRFSLMTVNRSGDVQKVRLAIPKWAGRSFNARQYYITGYSEDDANVEGAENRVVMQDRTMAVKFDAKGLATVNIPAFSVSSVIFEPLFGQ